MKNIRWPVAMASFAAGCIASAGLWRFWTPRCNEACPEWLALSMIAFAFALPLACLGTGVFISIGGYAARTRSFLSLLFVAVMAALAFALTWSVH